MKTQNELATATTVAKIGAQRTDTSHTQPLNETTAMTM